MKVFKQLLSSQRMSFNREEDKVALAKKHKETGN